MARGRIAAAVLASLVAASGCTGGGGGGAEPPPSGERVWLAVLDTAADPDDLDADTADLIERVGSGAVTSPAGCFPEGLEGVAPQDYVLGIEAEEREELDALVARSGRVPIFRGQVVDTCSE